MVSVLGTRDSRFSFMLFQMSRNTNTHMIHCSGKKCAKMYKDEEQYMLSFGKKI